MNISNSETNIETTVSPELQGQRYIYNGGTIPNNTDYAPRGNRRLKTRTRSPFKIISLLIFTSLVIVFYIWNKISVNRLVIEVNDLKNQCDKVNNTNEFLRAEINRKTSLERIEQIIATKQLGLIYPKEQPVWFELDMNRAERILD